MLSIKVYNRLDKIAHWLCEEKWLQVHSMWRVSESLHWIELVRETLGHRPYYITAWKQGTLRGILPLAEIRGLAFGAFLVSMPYVNWGGVRAIDEESEQFLLESAIQLAEGRDVDYLEIRGCVGGRDSRWIKRVGHKVIMVAELPETEGQLWQRLGSKIRNQIRKGLKSSFEIVVGGEELVRAFYAVYSANMHYLGTPAYPLDFVVGIVRYFSNRCDVVLVRYGRKVVAGGILLHGDGISEVPLAACLPEYRSSCANMVLYWELLKRSIERGAGLFDFGRCTPESGSYHFKKQWGARPQQLVWHYYIRKKEPSALSKENSRFRYWQELWKRLPGPIVRWLGPQITKGLPV